MQIPKRVIDELVDTFGQCVQQALTSPLTIEEGTTIKLRFEAVFKTPERDKPEFFGHAFEVTGLDKSKNMTILNRGRS